MPVGRGKGIPMTPCRSFYHELIGTIVFGISKLRQQDLISASTFPAVERVELTSYSYPYLVSSSECAGHAIPETA